MQTYDGVLTESEYADMDRLRRKLSSALLFLMLPGAKSAVVGLNERQSGRVSDQGLEMRVAGFDARVPWGAVLACAGSSNVIVLAIGRLFVPIARSLFRDDLEWQIARAIVERNVAAVPNGIPAASVKRTVLLWVVLLVVIFLAWHFAQVPSAR